jgi:hypothetical protein
MVFSERYFVIIKVYADEAGTHDKKGKQKGSEVPVLAGYLASVEYWTNFANDWQSVLNKYNVSYFHNKEFGFHARQKPTNPYRTWSEDKIRDFRYDLAMVAGSGAIPVGGLFWAEKHHALGNEGDAHKLAMQMFFNGFCEAMNLRKIGGVDKVLFIFDMNQKKEWVASLWEVYNEFKKKNPNFGGLTFEDDKDPSHLGLQAADLFASSCHNRGPDFMRNKQNANPPRIIDIILNRFSPKETFDKALETLPDLAFRVMIDVLRKHEIIQKREWKKQGLRNQEYLPTLHFPFEKYGIKTKPSAV